MELMPCMNPAELRLGRPAGAVRRRAPLRRTPALCETQRELPGWPSGRVHQPRQMWLLEMPPRLGQTRAARLREPGRAGRSSVTFAGAHAYQACMEPRQRRGARGVQACSASCVWQGARRAMSAKRSRRWVTE